MGHKKIKCNPNEVVSRAERVKERVEKRRRCEAASALLEISQEVSNNKGIGIYFFLLRILTFSMSDYTTQ
jgi:hypothetical protein